MCLRHFDPNSTAGPAPNHRFHINSVSAGPEALWFSGLRTPGLLRLDRQGLQVVAPLPEGTHNAQVLDGTLIYNDTESMRVCWIRDGRRIDVPVPDFDPATIINRERFASEVARPRFARGLCALGQGLIAAGSSPSTVSVYELRTGACLRQQNLSMDVRNVALPVDLRPEPSAMASDPPQ